MDPDSEHPDLVAELARLPRERSPESDLEERTVRKLRASGLLGESRRVWRGWAAVAAVLLFAAGIVAGRLSTGSLAPQRERPTFLLLLHGGPDQVTATDEARAVEEYRSWAIALRGQGRTVSGERLGDSSVIVPATSLVDIDRIRGYFVISATSLEDATTVARSCPHIRRGGRVIVRPIDPT